VRTVLDVDVGQVVGGKYVLVRLLGAGAMGQVWIARHQGLHQPFAIKLMLPQRGERGVEALETSLRRFENEAQIAAALSRQSRHIVQVLDYGIDDGTAYLVMELLEGQALDRRIGKGRALPEAEVSAMVAQIAKALAVAHAAGVTHRDLKPANVFLTTTEDGELLVKLLDFGIARMARRIVRTKENEGRAPTRLTVQGLVLGTPSYMSPEQATADSPDSRADVWSLAVLAYEALAGYAPFDDATPEDTLARICRFAPRPLRDAMPGASEALAAVFERSFAKKIEARFQTAAELANALAEALPAPASRMPAGPPADAARADTVGEMPRVPLRPRAGPLLAAGASVVLVASAIWGRGLFTRHGPSESESTSASTSASTSLGTTSTLTSTRAGTPAPANASDRVGERARVDASASASAGVGVGMRVRVPVRPRVLVDAGSRAAPPASSEPIDRSAVF